MLTINGAQAHPICSMTAIETLAKREYQLIINSKINVSSWPIAELDRYRLYRQTQSGDLVTLRASEICSYSNL